MLFFFLIITALGDQLTNKTTNFSSFRQEFILLINSYSAAKNVKHILASLRQIIFSQDTDKQIFVSTGFVTGSLFKPQI